MACHWCDPNPCSCDPAAPSHPAPELVEFLHKGHAEQLHKQGYICISNRYRKVGRPDRKDWHIALAQQMRCAPADFIKQDGSGKLCERWYEHYVRCISTDTMEIPQEVYDRLKKMM